MIDNDDGTYTVSYQPIVRGSHQITVTMRNININGSPFSVNVTGRMDFGKVGKVMACFGCEGTGGGMKTYSALRDKPILPCFLFVCLFVCLFVVVFLCNLFKLNHSILTSIINAKIHTVACKF